MEYLVHQLLERAAQRSPGATAVVAGPQSITYGELDRRASQVAHFLRSHGITRGDRVALYLEKSIESVIAVYGIMKSGACYVPLDPHAPTMRLAYILNNCSVDWIVTSSAKRAQWPEVRRGPTGDRALLVLDDWSGDTIKEDRVYTAESLDIEPGTPPEVALVDSDLAYILYTSGSTGNPKGVMLSHRNALAFVNWAAETFGISPDDRLSSHAPLHFDLSVFDLFAAAAGGAAVVVVPSQASLFPPELVRFIARERITIWYSVPSILSMLALRGGIMYGSLSELRLVLFAGEVFPTKYLRQLVALLPQARFANLYGPTETNVCTWYEVAIIPSDDAEPIPIGRAIANDEVFAVTDEGAPAKQGEVGELHVRGGTVMRGYWNDPDRTAKGLVPDPRGGVVVDRVYRTGDLVILDEHGDYHYIGRRDAQVKVRGYRIELGDVENALNSHPAVQECAVVAVPDELVTNRLRAFVVAEPAVPGEVLISHCASRTPKYMIPESIEFRDKLPRTSTGKIDRRSLLSEHLEPRPS